MVRAFWRDTADSRHHIYVDGTAEQGFNAVATEIWREYEAVLACSPGCREPRVDARPT